MRTCSSGARPRAGKPPTPLASWLSNIASFGLYDNTPARSARCYCRACFITCFQPSELACRSTVLVLCVPHSEFALHLHPFINLIGGLLWFRRVWSIIPFFVEATMLLFGVYLWSVRSRPSRTRSVVLALELRCLRASQCALNVCSIACLFPFQRA